MQVIEYENRLKVAASAQNVLLRIYRICFFVNFNLERVIVYHIYAVVILFLFFMWLSVF